MAANYTRPAATHSHWAPPGRWYTAGMTAKQALMELVEAMTEEAKEALAQFEWDAAEFDDEPLTEDEEAQLLAAEHAIATGDTVHAEDVFKSLGV